jgi:hypothetical protein
MPSDSFRTVVERAITDEAFAARLRSDRETALAEYDLSDDEKQALISSDPDRLSALGLDDRVSKSFGACWNT